MNKTAKSKKSSSRWHQVILGCAAGLLLAGCSSEATEQRPIEPPEVAIQVMMPTSVNLSTELAGRTAAFRIAEVRPQINGIIKQRLFEEGAEVSADEPLYQIDDAMYQAAYAKARATLRTTEQQAKRYAELLKIDAVSRQAHDDAQAAWEHAKAELEMARINLEYTKVLAPISGRVGRSAMTEGALVTQGQAAELATVRQLDPIYVDIKQPSVELLQLRQAIKEGRLRVNEDETVSVSLTLENGSRYEHAGQLQFSEVEVDEGTGSVTLRALFPNPERQLLPGMFVHAVMETGKRDEVFLVPNQALMLGNEQSRLYVVDENDVVHERHVKNEQLVDNQWLVSSGLEQGDRVVVEGRQKIRPGVSVRIAADTPTEQTE